MTNRPVIDRMIGHSRRAIGALRNPATLNTAQLSAVAPPVEKEDRLLSPILITDQFLVQD